MYAVHTATVVQAISFTVMIISLCWDAGQQAVVSCDAKPDDANEEANAAVEKFTCAHFFAPTTT